MRKLFQSFFSLLMVSMLLCSICLSASADGTVTYQGHAQEILFGPGGELSPTDLLDSFKDVMPGDSITQQVVIKNDAKYDTKVELYVRAVGAKEGSEEFLSQMTLRVQQNGDSIMYKAPDDTAASLSDWVYLGIIYSGGEITLDVTLDVPITMGNEFQEAVGYFDWEFVVEEYPVDPDDPSQTGESVNITKYVTIMLVSMCLILVLLILVKRSKDNAQQESA